MRSIGVGERRTRLAVRHGLATGARSAEVVDVARNLVGLHSTDAASVFLAAAARMTEPTVARIERALYEEKSVVRVLGMRRTMFVLPVDLAPVVQSACTRAIAARERRRLVKMLEQAGIAPDAGPWLRHVEEAAVDALAARGEALAAELASDVPDLGRQLVFAEGKRYEGRQSVATRVLFVLAADGRVVRVRPRGTWISSQYRWAAMGSWIGGGLPDLPAEAARSELARRWLGAFGPGTAADLKWWTGWTAGEVKAALADVGLVEVELDGATGLVLPGDLATVTPVEPWAALLPALDPTVMGWSQRGWFLGEHGPALFDRTGNAGPTVWWDGRIVGGWAQAKDGEVRVRLLEDVGGVATSAIRSAAAELTAWLGPARVTPRFRTPLELELSR